MTLGEVFRQVRGKLGTAGFDDSAFFAGDIISAINDAIRRLRVDYIQNGMGREFSVTETITVTIPDFDYPFLNSIELTGTLMRSLPTQFTILNSSVQLASKTITDQPMTFSEGNRAIYGLNMYEAVAEAQDEVTNDKLVHDYRTYRKDNGLYYKQGDTVRYGEEYFRVTEDFSNVGDNSDKLEKLYWKFVGNGFAKARFVDFSILHNTRSGIPQSFPFSIVENKLYMGFKETPFVITYIPEWTNVTDEEVELNVPDSMLPDIQLFVLRSLIGEQEEED